MKIIGVTLIAVLLASCGGSSGGSGGDNPRDVTDGGGSGVLGTITMSGNDTAVLGTQLVVGAARSAAATATNAAHVVMVDQGSRVTELMGVLVPEPRDPSNTFVFIALEDNGPQIANGISMIVVKNGAEYRYACTQPVTPSSDPQCGAGAVDLDLTTRTLALDDALVWDDDTGSELVLNGTVRW
jgi:hypothetical protein